MRSQTQSRLLAQKRYMTDTAWPFSFNTEPKTTSRQYTASHVKTKEDQNSKFIHKPNSVVRRLIPFAELSAGKR